MREVTMDSKDYLLKRLQESLQLLCGTQHKFPDVPSAVESCHSATRNEWVGAIDGVTKEATKVAMLWSNDQQPKEGILVLQALVELAVRFSVVLHNYLASAGPTLSSALLDSAERVLHSCSALVTACGEAGNPPSLLPQLAGKVWEACEVMKKTPLDNRSAVVRVLAQFCTSVKDVVREIDEMIQSPENGEVVIDSNDNEESDEDDLKYDFQGDFSDQDRKIIMKAQLLCQAVQKILKEEIYVVSCIREPSFGEEGSNGIALEDMLQCCKQAALQVDEVGASLYPPQDIEELQTAVWNIKSLVKKLKAMVLEISGGSDRFFTSIQACVTVSQEFETELDNATGCDE